MRIGLAVCLILCQLSVAAPPEKTPGQDTGALVAIGDVHGDLETFSRLLRKTGLVDDTGRWQGGSRHLVQTGDLVDRGAGSRGVLELLMRLRDEAKEAGGSVVVLLGNHEVMNLVGDLRYVIPGEFGAYAGEEDDRLRAAERVQVLALLSKGSSLLKSRYYQTLARQLGSQNFDRTFPPGYFAHREAFSSEGRFGKWLLERPFVHTESRVLFVHGGLTERFGRLPIDSINQQGKKELTLYLKAIEELETLGVYRRCLGLGRLQGLVQAEREAGGPHPRLRQLFATIISVWNGMLFSSEGPIWDRSLALGSEAQLSRSLDRILKTHGAARIVIGHSRPKSLKVEERFGGRVVLIDTGMNQSHYRGTPSALLLRPSNTLEVITVPGRP